MQFNWAKQAYEDLMHWAQAIGVGQEEIQNRLRTATEELRDKWNGKPKEANEEVFYRDIVKDSYLYDLTAWHTSGTIDSWFRLVRDVVVQGVSPRGKVLDYGAGIGTYSLIVGEAGRQTDACDINKDLRDYISWRARRHQVPVVPVAKPNPPYDAIVCIDTIEHLESPEEFPAKAREWLLPGGILIATWTFHRSDGMHPMHHDESRLGGFLEELSRHFHGPLAETWPAVFRLRPPPF